MRFFACIALFLVSIGNAVAGPAGVYLGVQGIGAFYNEKFAGFEFDDGSLGYKLYGGYRPGFGNFLDYFALEASWQTSETLQAVVQGNNFELEIDGFTVDVLGFIPVNEVVEVFGKVGYYDFDGTVTVNTVNQGKAGDESWNVGIGLDVGDSKHWRFRTELTLFDVGGSSSASTADYWTLGIGAQYNFGGGSED